MMRPLRLREHTTTQGVPLTPTQVDGIRRCVSSLQVQPSPGQAGHYDLRPGSQVGVLAIGDLDIEIRPKLPIQRVLFLLSYLTEQRWWRDEEVPLEHNIGLLEAMVPGFVVQVRRALRRGLLQGYQTQEEALALVRGRIRFDDQIRQRYGRFPPAEVRHDVFTEDIEANRLLKAATARLRRLRLRDPKSRRLLAEIDAALATVSAVTYHPRHLPEIIYNRLNLHYRPALELARLILRTESFDLAHGGIRVAGCLFDMNSIFEDFVVVALREQLGLSERQLPQGAKGRRLYLDRGHQVQLRPDISWWEGGRPVFVGDVKYKRTTATGVLHPDIYQTLAYAVATDLPAALLIYAAGESEPIVHRIAHVDKSIEVIAMDLSGPPSTIRREVERIAGRVLALRSHALRWSGTKWQLECASNVAPADNADAVSRSVIEARC